MKRLFTPKEAARAVALPLTHIQGWLQRSVFTFAAHQGHRRPRFDLRGLRILALMRELTAHGISPNVAAGWAATVVDRARMGEAIAGIFSRDPSVSPAIVPVDAVTAAMPLIVIPIQALFAEIDRRVQEL
ncbi:hypothetical protein [Bosea sp. 2RAB26]|uniref:hypothetical protein n=1 Tax=Bosea sp. 2RAB26 TaxID=3237476 RepID=UPI003F8D9F69